MTTSGSSSLYDTLGGAPAVTAAVEDFYKRVLGDAALAPFFTATNMERLKGHQVAFLSQALGGPQAYTGRPLRTAHTGMGVKDSDFDKVAQHLMDTLEGLGVPALQIKEVINLIAPLRPDIVGL